MVSKQVKAAWGVPRLQMLPDSCFQAAVLVCILLSVAPLKGDDARQTEQIAFIILSMEKAQSDVQLPRQIIREYHLGAPAARSSDSEVVAQMDFAPPGRYVIQKRVGSLRAEFVVKSVVQHELAISVSNQKLQAAAITRQNYEFRLLGDDQIDGHRCYLLQLIPKRVQPELIRGRVWVDQQSFLIRRIDGDLAKSPSWWVKTAHVDIRFAEFRGMWLQTSVDAQADIRWFGAQKLTSQVLDYTGTAVAEKNVVRSGRGFAITAVP